MAENVPALIIAGQHSFACLLENRGQRVLELLNDASTQFLQLHEVLVHRAFESETKQQLREATVPKASIEFVLVNQSKHESPSRRQVAFIQKQPYAAFMAVGGYELQGTVLLRGTPDSFCALARELSDFFPLTNCRVSMASDLQNTFPAGVALINKAKLSLTHIDTQCSA